MISESDILFARKGAAGLVTLNRPGALNAVTHGMVRALAAQLDAWAADDAVTRVVILGSGERAFSAGGDVRAVYDLGRAGRFDEALGYFRDEYVLNAAIKRYPKPYVALIDGILMGGGAGVSVHGSHRVAGHRFQFAMPETAIGFFPDVGGTWFLSHMPGETGTYAALTGARLGPADAAATGIATHRVASARFPALVEALCDGAPVGSVLDAFAEPAGQGAFAEHRADIDRLFAGDRVEDILGALDREGSDFARAAAATIRANSPTSLKLALAQVRRGKRSSFEECMRTEFRIVSRILHAHDMYEGIRAAVIDKDRAPRWRPASLAEVDDAEIARHFAPLADELPL